MENSFKGIRKMAADPRGSEPAESVYGDIQRWLPDNRINEWI
jgi:hypothetical protein